ncbi:MAG: hypothetical protein WAW36_08240, partial [Methylovulum miyakonense]
ALSKRRVFIEHVNRRCKIFRIVKDVYRGKHKNYSLTWNLGCISQLEICLYLGKMSTLCLQHILDAKLARMAPHPRHPCRGVSEACKRKLLSLHSQGRQMKCQGWETSCHHNKTNGGDEK